MKPSPSSVDGLSWFCKKVKVWPMTSYRIWFSNIRNNLDFYFMLYELTLKMTRNWYHVKNVHSLKPPGRCRGLDSVLPRSVQAVGRELPTLQCFSRTLPDTAAHFHIVPGPSAWLPGSDSCVWKLHVSTGEFGHTNCAYKYFLLKI